MRYIFRVSIVREKGQRSNILYIIPFSKTTQHIILQQLANGIRLIFPSFLMHTFFGLVLNVTPPTAANNLVTETGAHVGEFGF
jgi:hypothetical protein